MDFQANYSTEYSLDLHYPLLLLLSKKQSTQQTVEGGMSDS
jgi:hypothetical protein